ncbi:uncharacterized protein BDZ99DRAFT_188665 [Mytilinidion resinicola]|uniref:Uncharacterized protein n=1 Tax=Mytilinidion resinicola TaxID=574789 RepID=A0A6A6Z1E7_9PEZI|nr:uncharacterized protein BDZ99DRAFT_188665 [Mytilinidion resinicola]KAF2814992.1 hypothetical protein BDZ99DRAFT_188665 [Mytilinidion resinicola]
MPVRRRCERHRSPRRRRPQPVSTSRTPPRSVGYIPSSAAQEDWPPGSAFPCCTSSVLRARRRASPTGDTAVRRVRLLPLVSTWMDPSAATFVSFLRHT